MCHYLGGGLHGRQKRVKAQSESSKSVVNSVLISREMPVFPGFLEIIRVVDSNNKIRFSKIRLSSKDTATAFFAKLCYNWKQSLGAGAGAGHRPSDGRRIARVVRMVYPGGGHGLCEHLLTGKFFRPAIRVPRAEPKASAGLCLCPWQMRRARYARACAPWQIGRQRRVGSWQVPLF